MEEKQRSSKTRPGKIDKYYISPTGRRLKSLLAARAYVDAVDRAGGDESKAWLLRTSDDLLRERATALRQKQKITKNSSQRKKTSANHCAVSTRKPAGLRFTWMAKYAELKRFKARHGHLRVPQTSNQSLSQWVWNQRYYAKVKSPEALSSQRKQLLEELGFDFSNQQRNIETSLLSSCTTASKEKKNTTASKEKKNSAKV
jgi:hypothetical protein